MTPPARPLQIALLIGSANVGGAEGQLVRLAGQLRQRGHEVRVFFLATGGPLTAILDESGVPWRVLNDGRHPSSDTARAVLAVLRWSSAIARWRPDIVHAWLPSAVALGLPTARLVCRAKTIAAFRGQVTAREMRVRPLRRMLTTALRHADAVTINAAWLAQEAQEWGALPEQIVLIHNGVELPAVAADPSRAPATAVVVANFHLYKGHDVLLAALALLDNPPCVRLVGTGPLREGMREVTADLGLQHVVTFVDAPAHVAAELAGAQFAIHPSRTEGMSNAILEQIAAGLPVVATDVGAARVMVTDEESGFVVPAGTAEPLAAAISRLTADPALRVRMGAQARRRAETFSWAECATRTIALYTSVDEGSFPTMKRGRTVATMADANGRATAEEGADVAAEKEIAAGARFAFGKNWSQFLDLVDDERITAATDALTAWLGTDGWKGKRFLDIGSGSGLSSLAARNLGATVHSFDFDPSSVACTRALRARFRPADDPAAWTVDSGSVLDQTFLDTLGTFDIVYSWGVLHHTGDLWAALGNATDLVAEGGQLHVALYNDQGRASRVWTKVKARYNSAPDIGRRAIVAGSAAYLFGRPALLRAARAASRPRKAWAARQEHSNQQVRPRGMDRRRDLIDWVGGYPFEVSQPEDVFDFVVARGFTLTRLYTCGGGLGCNQFVFVRNAPRTALFR